jgi:hypothetical protein
MADARERELREKGAALARKLEEFARDDSADREELGQVLLGAYAYLEQRVGTLTDPPKPFFPVKTTAEVKLNDPN